MNIRQVCTFRNGSLLERMSYFTKYTLKNTNAQTLPLESLIQLVWASALTWVFLNSKVPPGLRSWISRVGLGIGGSERWLVPPSTCMCELLSLSGSVFYFSGLGFLPGNMKDLDKKANGPPGSDIQEMPLGISENLLPLWRSTSVSCVPCPSPLS